jgi:nucleoside diphosphate kinase
MVYNAVDACAKLGIDGDAMEKRWMKAKDDGQLIKFGGGFYCASIPATVATVSKSLYTINGFYMAMRDCYTMAGASIHWFDVEWNREKSSWADFRSVILGATDPEASAPGSLRGQIKAKWQELGLNAAPSIRDNGVHASASPLEAMAERANWLGDDLEQDTLSKALADVGVPLASQREWCQDAQVAFEGKTVSLFDTLEDLDVWPLMGRSARIMDQPAPGDDKKSSAPLNRALLFVKPHAFNDKVVALVRERLAAEGLTVRRDGVIGHQKIDEEKLIDKHYGAIASKASLLTPAETNPSAKARESFGMTFGLPWDDALASGQVLNAVDACKALNINGTEMATKWNDAKARGELIKFGGGFYCAKIA